MSKTTRMIAAVLFSGVVIVSSFIGVKAMAGGFAAPVATTPRTQAPSRAANSDRPFADMNDGMNDDSQMPAEAAPAAKTPSTPAPTAPDTSDAAVKYLNEIALDGFEFGSAPKVAYKWTQDVLVQVEGNPTASDRAALQQVVSDLNGLISPVKVRLVDQGGNVRIWYGPEKQFAQQDEDYTPGNLGYFSIRYDDNSAITHSSILIDTGTEATARAHLVREELTQSLGLFQDSWDYKDSMFYQGWTTPTKYSDLDQQIIHMLYDTRVKPGMSKAQVDALFTNN
jgi:hypothetical protein